MLRSRLELGFGAMMAACASWSARHAALVAGIFLVAAAMAGTYAYRTVDIDLDDARMVSPDAPFRTHAKAIQDVFPALDGSMTAVIEADDPTVARETADRLASAFRDRPELFSEIFAPGVGSFYEHNALLLLPAPEIQSVAVRLQRAIPMMQILTRQPDLVGLATGLDQLAIATRMQIFPPEAVTLLTEIDRVGQSLIDGRMTTLDWQSTLVGDLNRNRQSWAVAVKPLKDHEGLAVARALIADPAINPSGLAKIRLIGGPADDGAALSTVSGWALEALIIAFFGVCAIVLLGLRSIRLFIIGILSLSTGLAFIAAAGVAILGSITLPGVALAILFVGLAVDSALLVTLRFREERLGGRDQSRALAVTAKSCGLPLALAGMAMAIAFLSFWRTNLAAVAELGIVVAIAVVILWVIAMIFLPALLALLPIAPRRARPATSHVLGIVGNVLTSQPVRMLVTLPIVAAAAASVILLPQIEFERGVHPIAQPMMGTAQIMAAGEQRAKELHKAVEALPEVGAAISVFNFVPSGQDTKLAILSDIQASLPQSFDGRPQDEAEQEERNSIGQFEQALHNIASSSAPEAARSAAQTAAATLRKFVLSEGSGAGAKAIAELERALLSSLPATIARIRMLADASRISLETLDPELKRRYVGPEGRFLIDINSRVDLTDRQALQAFVTAIQSVAPDAGGPAVDALETARTLKQSLIRVLFVAAGVIGVLLLLLLPRLYDVFLVAIPVTLALLNLAGAMVLFDLPIIPLAVLAVPLLIGMGVGNGIKLLMRARESVRYATATRPSTPRAILWTTAAVLIGAGSLVSAPTEGPVILGTLLVAGLVLLTACTFVVLPTLVHWTLPRRVK